MFKSGQCPLWTKVDNVKLWRKVDNVYSGEKWAMSTVENGGQCPLWTMSTVEKSTVTMSIEEKMYTVQ